MPDPNLCSVADVWPEPWRWRSARTRGDAEQDGLVADRHSFPDYLRVLFRLGQPGAGFVTANDLRIHPPSTGLRGRRSDANQEAVPTAIQRVEVVMGWEVWRQYT